MNNVVRIGVAVASVAAVTMVGTPAGAAAKTGVATVEDTTRVQFVAAVKQANNVVLTRSGNTITIDDRVAIKAGKGCTAVKGDKTKVRCTPKKKPTWLSVHTKDKNDTIVNRTDLGVTVRAGSGNNRITGGPRGDNLYADGGNDVVFAGGGNDYVYAGYGRNEIHGGSGEDNLIGGENTDYLYGDAGEDRLNPAGGNDVAHGGPDGDLFDEGAGKDTLYGDGGSDSFVQNESRGRGSDTIRGGADGDAVYYYRTKRIVADADGAKGDDGEAGERDSIGTDVESLEGGSGNDWLAGNALANWINGGEGNDTILGGAGNDQLTGGDGNDKLYGEAGNDDLSGDYGSDLMAGGSGKDQASYYYRLVRVVLDADGVAGDDGSAGERDTIRTDVEDLAGGWGDDLLIGTSGPNLIRGGAGADVIRGGGGNDELHSDDGSRSGVDKLYGEAGDDVLHGDGYETYSRYLLDGGADYDRCVPGYRSTGELTDCELTGE